MIDLLTHERSTSTDRFFRNFVFFLISFHSIRIHFSGHRNAAQAHTHPSHMYSVAMTRSRIYYFRNLLRCSILIFAKSQSCRYELPHVTFALFRTKTTTSTDTIYSICVCCQSFVRRVRQSRLKITLYFSRMANVLCQLCANAFACVATTDSHYSPVRLGDAGTLFIAHDGGSQHNNNIQ